MSLRITDHAAQRAEERLGLRVASLRRLAGRAFCEGVLMADVRGRLKHYLEAKTELKGCDVRLYGEVCFVFMHKALLTVFRVPNEFRSAARKAGR